MHRVLFFLSLIGQPLFSQSNPEFSLRANLRGSILLFPFSPLLTLEIKAFEKGTVQLESNFTDTHGLNLKYFFFQSMDGHYTFLGLAFIENELLREDQNFTYLPYTGYGYAFRFGSKKRWTIDTRVGIGTTTNADVNGVYPVIKTGLGRLL